MAVFKCVERPYPSLSVPGTGFMVNFKDGVLDTGEAGPRIGVSPAVIDEVVRGLSEFGERIVEEGSAAAAAEDTPSPPAAPQGEGVTASAPSPAEEKPKKRRRGRRRTIAEEG